MDYQAKLKERACSLATSLLKSDLDYLDNVLELSSIGNSLYHKCWDTEFHTFAEISSETDHLPITSMRDKCSESMLEKSDIELKKIIKFYKLDIEKSCNQILSKHENI